MLKAVFLGSFMVVVGCGGGSSGTETPNSNRSQQLDTPDATDRIDATVSSQSSDGAPTIPLNEQVAALIDHTCVENRCPDGSDCVALRAFGIQDKVCFKSGKTANDIQCPAGTHIFALQSGVPNWYCTDEH